MKVPTYERQTGLAEQGGARGMGVRADGGALSAQARAMSSFGDELQRQGLTFYESLLKERRQASFESAETALGVQVAALQLDDKVLQGKPSVVSGNGPNSFKALAKKLQTNIANNADLIDDPVVKKRFLLASNRTIANATIQTNKVAHNREIDQISATKFERADHLATKFALSADQRERDNIRRELFGEVEITETDINGNKVGTGKYVKKFPSYYDGMAAAGLITSVSANQAEDRQKNTIIIYEIEAELNNADLANSSVLANNVVEKLQDPTQHTDLDLSNRSALLSRAINMTEAIERASLAASEGAGTDALKAEKEYRRKAGSRLLSTIIAADDVNQRVTMPTLQSVTQMLAAGDITPEVAKFAETRIRNNDAREDNPAAVLEYTDMIATASTQDELDGVTAIILRDTGTGNNLTLDTAESLVRFANSQESGTSDAEAYKVFKKQLSDLTLGGRNETSSGYELEENALERHLDAQLTFFKLTNDRFAPMKPEQAFEQIKKQFLDAKLIDAPFLYLSSLFPNLLPNMAGLSLDANTAKEVFFAQATPAKISRARIALALRIGAPTNTLTRLEVALEEETLDLLENEILKYRALNP